jgi:hypothetical protein
MGDWTRTKMMGEFGTVDRGGHARTELGWNERKLGRVIDVRTRHH